MIGHDLDDDECMSYLNDWDERISHLDVVDDYQSEKEEIKKVQGADFPFSFGDVCRRTMTSVCLPFVEFSM